MKLEDITVRNLLPIFMRRDAFDVALADALSAPLKTFARECRKLSTFDALSELSEEELDALADELNVFWYDVTYTVEQKRALLAQSDLVYMRLGTKAAVKQIVESIFGPTVIEEFFEYGGKPHYFRLNVQNAANLSAEGEAKLMRLLDLVKRRSQWLDKIITEIALRVTTRVGVLLAQHKAYRQTLDTWQDNATATGIRAGGSAEITNSETTTAKP